MALTKGKKKKSILAHNEIRITHLSELAQIVLTTPTTQVSVDRCFLALSFIFSEKRSSLSPENLNTLLIIKFNT